MKKMIEAMISAMFSEFKKIFEELDEETKNALVLELEKLEL